ncbi:hypothetical protein QTP88_000880 [Uroleucon formosanum]
MFKYYFKRAGNNQTIHISQRTWSILNLDRSIDVDSLTPNECLSYIETVKHSEITEAFSHCRNIKLPSDVKEIAELNFGILFSLELPNKLTKEEFTQKSLEEKIELLSVPKSLYLYYFLSKDDLIQILRFFNKEFSKNSETIELRLLVRSILNRNQSEDDNDSDPDFIPKPFNIEQRSPVITRSKKRDTELVDPNNINNRLETFNMSKPIFFKPEFYSGEPDECVNDFIENYNLISAANEWSDDKKIMYAPIYLKKSAKAFYQNYIISNPTPSWSHFELALKEYFMSPGRARMLKAKLTNRKLKSNETVSQFLADFQLLAHKVNPNMAESEKIDLILEALPPDFYNPVALMNNNTLSDLQNNLRKVESAKATVNERNNLHNFDALKAEIEVLNKKLVEQNALGEIIEIESSLNRVVVWYFRKNVDNVANYRAFLTSIESELIAKLCECTRIHPIKYNIKLEATYVVPNVANSAQNRAFKTSAKELYAHSNVASSVDRHFTRLQEVDFCKPIYIGFAVLELSKVLMYGFHYDVMKRHYRDRIELLYTDTDSLFYRVETKDFYDDLAANPNLMRFMDTSNLPSDHKCYSAVRKRIPGLFKNETDSRTVYEFVALRAKSYAYDVEQNVCIRAKGVMGHVIRNHLTFAEHKRCLFADVDDGVESDECDDEFDVNMGKMIAADSALKSRRSNT